MRNGSTTFWQSGVGDAVTQSLADGGWVGLGDGMLERKVRGNNTGVAAGHLISDGRRVQW